MAENDSHPLRIPEQIPLPWSVAFAVSWAGLRRRLLRSVITMAGVILAIAFLAFMLITDNINRALIEAFNQFNNNQLLILLQNAQVDISSNNKTDEMMILLIGLSLLTCTVGIVNSMLMSVTERVREIGTLKCLGAADVFIVKAYFIESSLQGICGAVLGMVIGMLVAITVALVNYRGFALDYLPYFLVAKSMVQTFVIGSLMSIVAAIAPAYMAARKRPVDALRVEA